MKPTIEVLRTNEHKSLKHIGWDGECLVWVGGIDAFGYGEFQFRHRGHPNIKYKIRAHHAVFLLNGGIIPEGIILRHTCDKPTCVSFTHVIPGTHVENVADRVSRGRSATGQRNGRFIHGKFCRNNINDNYLCPKEKYTCPRSVPPPSVRPAPPAPRPISRTSSRP